MAGGVGYTDIEIGRELSGAPFYLYLYQQGGNNSGSRGESQWQLSLSHDQDYAIATALICSPQSLNLLHTSIYY